MKLKFVDHKRIKGAIYARLSGYLISFSTGARKAFPDLLIEDAEYVIGVNELDQKDKRIFIALRNNYPDQPAFQIKFYSGYFHLHARSLLSEMGLNSFSGYRAELKREEIEGIKYLIINPEKKIK